MVSLPSLLWGPGAGGGFAPEASRVSSMLGTECLHDYRGRHQYIHQIHRAGRSYSTTGRREIFDSDGARSSGNRSNGGQDARVTLHRLPFATPPAGASAESGLTPHAPLLRLRHEILTG